MRAPLLALAATLAVDLAGCGGKASDPEVHPPAPTGILAEEGSTFDEILLRWKTANLNYEFEYRVLPDTTWARLHGASMAWGFGAKLDLRSVEPPIPELATVEVRVRAYTEYGGWAFSDWGSVSFRRGVRPPSRVTAVPASGGVAVCWENASKVADALLLERAPAGASPPEWTAVDAAFPAVCHTDATASADPVLAYRYRVRYARGDTWSLPAEVATYTTELLAPIDLRATPTASADGVVVTWTNRTTAATEQLLEGPTPSVVLPPGATSFVDRRIPAPGDRYRLVVRGAPPSADSPFVAVGPFRRTTPVGTFDARPIDPNVPGLARTADGWAYSDGWLHVTAGDAVDVAPAYACSGCLASPRVLVDRAGRVHSLFHDFDGLSWRLAHVWGDAAGWHEERSPELVLSIRALAFDVAPDGTLHVAADAWDGATGFVLHGAVAGGVWSMSPAAAIPISTGLSVIAGDDGTDYVLAPGAVASLATRPPGGAFTVEPVPFPEDLATVPKTVPALLGGAAGRIGVVAALAGGDVAYVERVDGAWGPVARLAPSQSTLGDGSFAASASRDLAQVDVVVADGASGMTLFRRAAGTWGSDALYPSSGMAYVQAGRGPDGRLWVTYGAPGSLWEEVATPAP